MNRKIFDHTNPFTVPEGYFDTLQDRIMERVDESLTPLRASPFKFQVSSFKFNSVKGSAVQVSRLYRTLLAVAACILFIFTGAALYTVFSERQTVAAEWVVDDDFYRWVYTSEGATLLAESLDIEVPEYLMTGRNDFFEENDAIISFLERDNISVAAIAMFMYNDL